MNVRDAKICPSCDEIYKGKQCSRCGEENGAYIFPWVKPMFPKPEERHADA